MSQQHHAAQAERTGVAVEWTPEQQAQRAELQAVVNKFDTLIRDTDDDDVEALREFQKNRNEAQNQLDDLRREIERRPMHGDAVQRRQAAIDQERDQLVVAQNAPFTDTAPQASGGESATPEGVLGRDAVVLLPHAVVTPGVANVVESKPK